jgi:hypothetical protein
MLPPQQVLRNLYKFTAFSKALAASQYLLRFGGIRHASTAWLRIRRPGRTTEAISAIQKSWKSSPRDGSSLYRVVGNVVSQGSVVVSLILVAIVHRLLDRPGQREAAAGSGRRLD